MRLKSLLIILFIASGGLSYCQPQITIHLKGGYNIPLAELKGNINDSADRTNTYVMANGYYFGGDLKYYVLKELNLLATFNIGYNIFTNTRKNVYGFGKDERYSLNAFALGAGLEYSFLPKGKVNPFIGFDLTGHLFNGKKEIVTIAGTVSKLELRGASRFGIAAGLGIEIALGKCIGITAGSKYQIANLIGKDSISNYAVGKFSLVDAEYTVYLDKYPAKNISYLQFYTGVSFYFNPRKKEKK
ncbi:MAG TPA: hypothetical protein VGK25_12600 [Ignavibacteria bacterium]